MLSAVRIAAEAGEGQLPEDAASWPAAGGAEFHTGRLRPGDVFFALPGERSHGIEHAAAALSAGAAFIVSDRPHPRGVTVADPRDLLFRLGAAARQQITGRVIGVTGSVGKTSTKELLAVLLDGRASPGNLNTPLALACTLLRAALEQPDADLVLELGIDRPDEMDELLELTRPDAGLLTFVGASHLDGLGDLAGVVREKRRLLDSVALAFASSQAAAHLGDVPAHVRVYGMEAGVHERGELQPDGRLSFRNALYAPPLPGEAHALNLTGALALASAFGVEQSLLGERLEGFRPPGARLEFIRLADGRLLIDDTYNSNPASAAAALEVLRASPAPRAAVLGDMRELGEESARHHRKLGEATRGLDMVVAVGDHAEDVRAGNPGVLTAADTDEALGLLSSLPQRGTLLLKASRGLAFERLATSLVES